MISSRAGQAFLFSFGIGIVVGSPEPLDSYDDSPHIHTVYVLLDYDGTSWPGSRFESELASYEASGLRLL